ncbi:unnamed protein product [Trichobilharzia regenti]|nr:unnamed protein product [Trichobilharzia regenti]
MTGFPLILSTCLNNIREEEVRDGFCYSIHSSEQLKIRQGNYNNSVLNMRITVTTAYSNQLPVIFNFISLTSDYFQHDRKRKHDNWAVL